MSARKEPVKLIVVYQNNGMLSKNKTIEQLFKRTYKFLYVLNFKICQVEKQGAEMHV